MFHQKRLFIVAKESSKMICLNFVRHFVKSRLKQEINIIRTLLNMDLK